MEQNKIKMLVTIQDRGYRLDYMNEEDLRSLRNLIRNGGLCESRKWHDTLEEINTILKDK